MPLPEYVTICSMCDGKGEYPQRYTAGCGMGYFTTMGPCEICGRGMYPKGVGYVYKYNNKPVPQSVVDQINNMKDTT